jgi:tRNA nucleotidyltransferase (CCA-adding enzyme)
MNSVTENLSIYLVGGAVRDQLMGLEVKDRDWVVTGATPAQMIERGFRPVGKDFPVFLHPQTQEEYALARTERKTAPGYQGFAFISDPTVTLEQDLMRRDLTINAMAQDQEGNLIDPWGGQLDIENRVLRHVSPAFVEDPVRVLRLARFAARFAQQNFKVAEDTLKLMQDMAISGEVDALVAERVWQELDAALGYAGFRRFVEVLRDADALAVILPEVEALFGVPQTAQYHPEIDSGLHTLMVLDAAARANANRKEMFAVLVHDLGKALTPHNQLPAHRGHEKRGRAPVEALCDRLRVPTAYRQLALKVCEHHLLMHRMNELKPATVLKLLEALDSFRKPDEVRAFVTCCAADMRGRLGSEDDPYPQGDTLLKYYAAAALVDSGRISSSFKDGGSGEQIKHAVRQARINAIKDVRRCRLSRSVEDN